MDKHKGQKRGRHEVYDVPDAEAKAAEVRQCHLENLEVDSAIPLDLKVLKVLAILRVAPNPVHRLEGWSRAEFVTGFLGFVLGRRRVE